MNDWQIALIICSIITVVALIALIAYLILKSPFKYPYCTTVFNISGKRSPNVYDLIDEYLNQYGITDFFDHIKSVEKWKNLCKEQIENSKLKNLRLEQFQKIIDDKNMYCFELIRKQTRYKQSNYVKTPYTVLRYG